MKKPLLAVDWNTAVRLCAEVDKRLCTADEWTLACEGDGRLPYPYGYARNKEACNIDKPYILPNDLAYADPLQRAAEVARLDQSEPSGNRASCVSPFGVFDMTGNTDEWVEYERGSLTQSPYRSGLKGGYWGPVRNRCRPVTATHNPWHSGYQIGGTSPFGTKKKLRVYLERSALELPRIYVNGGRRGFLVGIAPGELVRTLQPTLVDVALED